MPLWNKRREPDGGFANLPEAAEAGDASAVQSLLRRGANVNAQDERGATALHIAAARGHLEIAKLLIENGADVNFLIEEGGTPLMTACSTLHPEIVALLLANGADPSKKGDGGRVPLSCPYQPAVAALAEQIECINLLLEYGANINEQKDTGGTALMTAAWYGNGEAVEELLRLGADSTLRDHEGRTAAMLAFQRGHDSLAKRLKEHAERPA